MRPCCCSIQLLFCNGIHPFWGQLHIWHLCVEQFSKHRRLIDHWRSVPHDDVRDRVVETSTGAMPPRLLGRNLILCIYSVQGDGESKSILHESNVRTNEARKKKDYLCRRRRPEYLESFGTSLRSVIRQGARTDFPRERLRSFLR